MRFLALRHCPLGWTGSEIPSDEGGLIDVYLDVGSVGTTHIFAYIPFPTARIARSMSRSDGMTGRERPIDLVIAKFGDDKGGVGGEIGIEESRIEERSPLRFGWTIAEIQHSSHRIILLYRFPNRLMKSLTPEDSSMGRIISEDRAR